VKFSQPVSHSLISYFDFFLATNAKIFTQRAQRFLAMSTEGIHTAKDVIFILAAAFATSVAPVA
jgi:hypothetical protein